MSACDHPLDGHVSHGPWCETPGRVVADAVPAAAITAATLALHQPKDKCGCQSADEHAYWLGLDEADAKRALEAAAPHIAAAEKERIIGYQVAGEFYHPADVVIVRRDTP